MSIKVIEKPLEKEMKKNITRYERIAYPLSCYSIIGSGLYMFPGDELLTTSAIVTVLASSSIALFLAFRLWQKKIKFTNTINS